MIRITSQLAAALRGHSCKSMHQAFLDAEAGIMNMNVVPGQREAWHVAQLCASIRGMAQAWRKELSAAMPDLTLSMSSVFTHQKPYVQWPKRLKGNPRCELADLLVAVIDRRANPAKGFAVLIQAKLSNNQRVSLTPRERTQFDLLSQRPIFDICTKNGPTQVDLQSYFPDSALLYGLACNHAHLPWPFCECCHHETWLTADALVLLRQTSPYRITASETFSSVLVGLLQGNYGWEFDLPPHGQNWRYFATHPRHDWSMLINFLLENTFKGSMSKRLQSPAGQISRGKEDQLYLMAQTPHKASMFFVTDGFNQLSQLIASTSDTSGGPEWTAADPDLANGDGGGDRGFGADLDEPEDGAISTMIIEIGTQS